MEEIVRSTKSQIEEFKESLIWQDIVDQLLKLRELATLEYDLVGEPHINDQGYHVIPNQSETLIHLGDIKGRKKAVEHFLSIPDILLQTLEVIKDDSERERTE